MTAETGGEIPRTDFEAKFRLAPLGDDMLARVERAETLLGAYLTASLALNETPNFTTIRFVERLPLPRRETVTRIVDAFRDPQEVRERRQWELDNPDCNP
ncbi:MAG: hypothetical protein WDN66_02625 [Candidatus Saccharibacteria bacterium]